MTKLQKMIDFIKEDGQISREDLFDIMSVAADINDYEQALHDFIYDNYYDVEVLRDVLEIEPTYRDYYDEWKDDQIMKEMDKNND